MTPSFSKRKAGMALVLTASFLLGYNLLTAEYKTCAASSTDTIQHNGQPNISITGGNCTESVCDPYPSDVVICDVIGTSSGIKNAMWRAFEKQLKNIAKRLEQKMADYIDATVEAEIFHIHNIESDMVSWFETFWYYNFQPNLQAMTRQINTATADMTKNFAQAVDTQLANQRKSGGAGSATGEGGYEKNAQDDRKNYEPSESVCAVGTVSGGLGRALSFSSALRKGWQTKAIGEVTARQGSVSAKGPAAVVKYRSDLYESTFCDPNDNAGKNTCGATDPKYYNADTEITKNIFNKLTIPVTDQADGDKAAAAVEQGINNMVGVPAADPMARDVMASDPGREQWLKRRAYLARYNAVRSVPQLIAGWRAPGAGLDVGGWVKELREGTKNSNGVPMIPAEDLSPDPSYREIVHAIAVDRFNTGGYAGDQLTQDSALEMEKLVLDSVYLMQLRDYYELLERTALTLSVQVSLMAKDIRVPAVQRKR